MRYGLAITTFARPADAARIAVSAAGWTSPPVHVVIADNSSSGLSSLDGTFEVIGGRGNVGLPAGLAACFERLSDCDAVLVLDDDTELLADTAAMLLAHMDGRVGVVAVPRNYTKRMPQRGRQLFPWSPSLVSQCAIETVGMPRTELFFGLDDWDFGVRVTRAGFEIRWVDAQLPQQSLGETWDGRAYLTARNATYLAVWANRDRVFWRVAWAQVSSCLVPGRTARLRRRGIVDGLLRRMGAPPAGLSAGHE